jgi:DNA-binding winged helix-turn-helix (wHTH) protein
MIARFGAFSLDSEQRRLAREGRDVHLTPKAFDLLLLLMEEAPSVVRKEQVHDRLWPGTFVSDSSVLGLVKELRRALDDRDPKSPLIRTAHRVGYAFCAPLEQKMSHQPAGITRWLVIGTRRIVLQEGEHLIGRDPAATVWVDAPSVSRHHARIRITGAGAVLEDLTSKNGTKIDDAPLTEPVKVHDGNRIQIGSVVMVFHASGPDMSTKTVSGHPQKRSGKALKSRNSSL